jgi:type II secretory pathway pseudopilin PulG
LFNNYNIKLRKNYLKMKFRLKNTKKAAMFGLDARIALAIFGALSVISGAALYSAINDAKATAAVTELSELGKAYDAYYLDTGEELDIVATNIYLNIEELLTSLKKGWSGPYVSGYVESSHWLKPKNYLLEELRDNGSSGWDGTSQTDWSNANCTNGSYTGTCYVWLAQSLGQNKESFAKAIDKKVDGVVNGAEGNLRYFVSSGGNYYVLLKHRASFRY